MPFLCNEVSIPHDICGYRTVPTSKVCSYFTPPSKYHADIFFTVYALLRIHQRYQLHYLYKIKLYYMISLSFFHVTELHLHIVENYISFQYNNKIMKILQMPSWFCKDKNQHLSHVGGTKIANKGSSKKT